MQGGVLGYFKNRPSRRLVAANICMLGICAFFTYLYVPAVANLPSGSTHFEGIIVEEPLRKTSSSRYTVLVHMPQARQHMRLRVSSARYPQFEYGDMVSFECALQLPQHARRARAEDYDAQCYARSLVRLGNSAPSHIFAALFKLKRVVGAQLSSAVRYPYDAFIAGIVYGERTGLPQDWYTALIDTGTVHIVAISGYNITLIVALLASACSRLPLARNKAMCITVLTICAFVVFVGMSASVVRAAIFGSLGLIARVWGKYPSKSAVLTTTAAAMALCNPYGVLYDAGFQLSFLATVGLMYGTTRTEFFSGIPEVFGLKEALAQTTAATLLTSPLIVLLFGRVSVLGIAANVALLWSIPLLMAMGVLCIMLSVAPPFASVAGMVTESCVALFMGILRAIAKLPFASFEVSMSFGATIVCYAVIAAFLAYVNRKKALV